MKKLLENHLLYLTILILSVFYACNNTHESTLDDSNAADTIASPPGSAIYIDLKQLLNNKKDKDATVVNVKYDHYFKSPKKYKGFPLNTIIDSVVKVSKVDTASTLVVFECSDGYKPIMDFSKLYTNAKGYIVYKDLAQSGEKKVGRLCVQ